MNTITKHNLTEMPLETQLQYLEKLGNPMLHKMKNGWHARIEIFVTGEGVQFDIKTEFDHKTPMEAVSLLIDRVKKAMTDIKKVDQ